MNYRHQRAKYSSVIFVLTILSFLFFQACKKINENKVLQSDSLQQVSQSVVEEFYSIPIDAHPAIKKIAKAIKQKDPSGKIALKIASEAGLPYWKKPMIRTVNGSDFNSSSLGLDNQPDNADTVFVNIPLVPANTSEVDGLLACKIFGDSVIVKYLNEKDYKSYGFNLSSSTNAHHFTGIILTLQNNAFGTRVFEVHDGRVFTTNSNADSTQKRLVKLKVNQPNQDNLATESGTVSLVRCVSLYLECADPMTTGSCTFELCYNWQTGDIISSSMEYGGVFITGGTSNYINPNQMQMPSGGSGAGAVSSFDLEASLNSLITLTQVQKDFLGIGLPTINPLAVEVYLFLSANLTPDFTQEEKVKLIQSHINLLMANTAYRDYCNSQIIYTTPQQYGDLNFLLQSVWFAPDRLIGNPSLYSNITKLKLNAEQAFYLLNNNFINSQVNDLLNKSYSHLTITDKKLVATEFINKIMADPQLFELAQQLNSPNAITHPWMVELFKELALELGWKIIKKYIPGYGDWQSIKDAIEEAKDGDWLGMLGEVLNIVKKKVPALAVIDAIVDLWENIPLVNKAWKAFDKLKELPTNAFNSLLSTIQNRCGGLIGKVIHDDIAPGNSQAFLQYNPSDAKSFFQELANKLGKTVNPTSNGGGWFDLSGIRFNYYVESSSVPHLPTLEVVFSNGTRYKLRFIN